MRVQFQKLSNDCHRLTVIRDNGTQESAELESKSLLFHDFLHLAIESEAMLKDSFWNQVACGRSFLELAGKEMPADGPIDLSELATTEIIVGASSRLLKESNLDLAAFVDHLCEYLPQIGREIPEYLTVDFFQRIRECLRRIIGQWRATPFGEIMEINWEMR